jgi:crotonobetainyl-CoA:carnitine CoA-transferase CaiB-like acyl-CoA transferase
VAGWTSTLDQYQAEAMLQAAGVPSSAVQNSAELSQDPQLAHRGHFVQVNHPLHGTIFVESPPIRLSLTPGSIQSAAPILGGDTQHVLADILGYNEEQITELAADGALG